MKNILLVFILVFFALSTKAQDLKDPESNFDALWNDFKSNYKMFRVKNIQWDSLYSVYRPMVNKKTSDKELFSILSQLMYHLNDNHCWLETETMVYKSRLNVTYAAKNEDAFLKKYHTGNFSLPLIETSYLKNKKFATLLNGNYQHGWLKDSIGYIHFNEFTEPLRMYAIMDSLLSEFHQAKGLIIDVRSNTGGYDRVGKIILDRFCDTRRLYAIVDSSAYVYFKGDEKFGKKFYFYTEPRGKIRFDKSVVVLTDKTSYSAADVFASGCKNLPNMILIGDTTSGCTANIYRHTLPNGWAYTIAMGVFYTAKGECLDGIGVAPDIWIKNSKRDITSGKDVILERGMYEVYKRTFVRGTQNDYSIINSMAPRIGDVFLDLLYENKTDDAFQYFRIMMDQYPLLCRKTLSEEYLNDAAWDFMEIGQQEIGIKLFKLNNELFTYSESTFFNLGKAYEEIGQKEAALFCYQETKRLNPLFRSNYYVSIDKYLEKFK